IPSLCLCPRPETQQPARDTSTWYCRKETNRNDPRAGREICRPFFVQSVRSSFGLSRQYYPCHPERSRSPARRDDGEVEGPRGCILRQAASGSSLEHIFEHWRALSTMNSLPPAKVLTIFFLSSRVLKHPPVAFGESLARPSRINPGGRMN